MSVHEAITRHSREQHEHLQTFARLDEERERLIDEAIRLCLAGEPFSVAGINAVTAEIQAHAKQGISPLRRFVTEEMVREYADKLRS